MFAFPLIYFTVTGILLTSEKINLQLVQGVKCFDWIKAAMPFMITLQVLPIQHRIQVWTLKALHGDEPLLVSDLLHLFVTTRTRRSIHQGLLSDLKSRLKTKSDRPLQSVRLFSLSLVLWTQWTFSQQKSESLLAFRRPCVLFDLTSLSFC